MTGRRPSATPGSERGLARALAPAWYRALADGALIALDSLRANKLRSGLTVLGVVIGVAVVMVMAAVIQGIDESFTSLISARGPTTFYVSHSRFEGAVVGGRLEDEEPEFLRNPPIDPRWADELRDLPGIADAAAYSDLSQVGFSARWRSETVDIALAAVASNFLEIDAGDVTDGRFFTATEDRHGRPVALVDSAVTEDLFRGRDPLGRRIRIRRSGREGGTPFEVVGNYDPPASLFSGILDHYVLVPFWSAWRYVDVWDRLVTLVVQPEEDTSLVEALEQVRGRMRQLRGLQPGQPADFAIITQDEIVALWNALTAALFSVMVALSSVGLMVGGIGVIGVMLISVTERTREIGIRKAVGARRRDLLWQFLVEAATLTLLGGALGLALGGAVTWAIAAATPVPVSVPLWAVAAALLAAALTGIGFGLYPAARGARLDPVDALRYE